ncbi:MAG TPA: thioredoxin-like domain-containing protein [Flavobacteriales bacterium]|nr:thioredoxin-like domain-containing protein [Flavobacteriales bacterium]
MLRFLFLIILIFSGSLAFAGNCKYMLKATFANAANKKIVLSGYYGIKLIPLDSVVVSASGKFHFLNKKYRAGFYNIKTANDGIDFIFNENECTEINFKGKKAGDEIEVKGGIDQKGLIELRKQKLTLRAALQDLVKKDTLLTDLTKSEIKRLIEEDAKKTGQVMSKYKGTLFVTTALLAMPEKIDSKTFTSYQQDTITYFKDHFFDNVDFSNEALCRTTLLPNLYMRYLSKYVQYDEQGFKNAIDLILNRAKANQLVYNLSLEYLMDLFQQAGPEIVFEYILETYYLENACDNVHVSSNVRKKIESWQVLSPGQDAPLLEKCISYEGDSIVPSDVFKKSNKSTLLFFWSTHCSFCKELMNMLEKSAVTHMQLVGINIDDDINEWKRSPFSKIKGIINLYSPGGWESPAARKYLVNKTPTIYLINSFGKIEKRNISLEDVYLVLNPKH